LITKVFVEFSSSSAVLTSEQAAKSITPRGFGSWRSAEEKEKKEEKKKKKKKVSFFLILSSKCGETVMPYLKIFQIVEFVAVVKNEPALPPLLKEGGGLVGLFSCSLFFFCSFFFFSSP